MSPIECIKKRNKLRKELSRNGIFTNWDFARKVMVLYIPGIPGTEAKEVGYLNDEEEAIFYESGIFQNGNNHLAETDMTKGYLGKE